MTYQIPKKMYPKDPLLIGAWASALKVFLSREDTMKLYKEETGDDYEPSSTDLSVLAESKKDFEFTLRFIKYFNENVWGDLNMKAGE